MPNFPSRHRRLDEILADLPLDEPMLLSELDGYLTALAVHPEPIAPDAWMPPIWDGVAGETPPFDDATDVRLFGEMVLARHAEILRDLARGKPQPIFEVDARNGDMLWEIWMAGFAHAMDLWPDGWSAGAGDPADTVAALAGVRVLVDVADDASDLPYDAINAVCDTAPAAIAAYLVPLYARRVARIGAPVAAERPVRTGRNDPCACGSGAKSKRCCG